MIRLGKSPRHGSTGRPEKITASGTAGKVNEEFTAVLGKSPETGDWTYVVRPRSAEFFGA
ncbi:hypothetical protein AQI88_15435 [Streptomyces cellostaticus]|uniref:Uncharacterized protein n=1 Tax=Streptomyces cellostaticus TaxID=67285 RepID=A0A124HCU2_9ACTN|nr:hypothetical protein AQI88_15435 [Streptomyces cellostaticus]GHI09959.1 hypothetical protein Scel_82800 [Streptomyces cellostaticus]